MRCFVRNGGFLGCAFRTGLIEEFSVITAICGDSITREIDNVTRSFSEQNDYVQSSGNTKGKILGPLDLSKLSITT